MTLEEPYKEIMDHITVTEDLRRRVLLRLREEPKPAFPLRRGLCVAAALALLVVGGQLWLQRTVLPDDPSRPPVTSTRPPFQTLSSAQALSQAVGFPVEEAAALPFPVTETVYTAFGSHLAEIRYSGPEQSAVYRKAPGQEDPSGDYTAYDDVRSLTLDGISLTLRGTQGSFSLAVWADASYAYSLRLDVPLDTAQWTSLLPAFLEGG